MSKSASNHSSSGASTGKPLRADKPKSAAKTKPAPKPKPELSPEEIRAIREGLGLSQAEAGDLLGGGPRAFTKYESGAVKPAAAVVSLLRLLEANPAALNTLAGRKAVPISTEGAGPFEVTGHHIAELSERSFSVLLRKLLVAEAQASGLPAYGVHVAGSITTPDAGEDGRITWTGGPERTDFLPARFSQFQLKAGKITPTNAAGDVLTKSGEIKPMVREALESGGVYTMLSAHSYVAKAIRERENQIRWAIRGAGLDIKDEQIVFRDADQIATWTSRYPAVTTWLLEQTQPGLLGPFRSWSHWAGRPEHEDLPWVEDTRLAILRRQLREFVTAPRGVARIVGPSGIGKSRLTLEALGLSEEEEAGQCISDIVLYAVESEAGALAISNVVQNLADSGVRAIVVVDHCAYETHQNLAGMVVRKSSRLLLITIDDETPSGTLEKTTFKVDEAPISVTEAIINQVSPGLPSEDQRRLVRFSKGFPKIAILVGRSWTDDRPLAHATDDTLVDGVLLGRKPREADMMLRAAPLLATFGLVGVKPSTNGQLAEIAALGRSLTEDDMRVAVEQFVRRGVAQRRGRAVVMQPRPIALRLAERQWRTWSPAQWDKVLTGKTSADLKVMAARQLALLNTTDTAKEVVQHVCRYGGPLDGLDNMSGESHAEILSTLAEIDAETVVRLIERSLENTALKDVDGDVRRHLVWALDKIAFEKNTFEDGARLLLRLAVNENESWSNNATGQFKNLFPVLLGNTAAGPEARLAVLDDAADTKDPKQKVIVAEALVVGAKTNFFSRGVGPEIHGSRPALQPWQPETSGDAWSYIESCIKRLVEFAVVDDEAGAKARTGLGHNLRELVLHDRIDTVEVAVQRVHETRSGSWPEALESLGDILTYDAESMNKKLLQRVKQLIATLKPNSYEGRVQFLVTEMPWDYPCDEGGLSLDERGKCQLAAVRELAAELVARPDVLKPLLPQLSRGKQRMAASFGQAIAELANKPLDWLVPLTTATAEAPDNERNYDLIAGYMIGISKAAPEVVKDFKQKSVTSPQFAPALPMICCIQNITETDITLVISALQSGLLPPSRLMHWTIGGVLAKLSASAVAPFLDFMLDFNAEAYGVGLELLGMYGYRDPSKFEGLRPQIRKAAENASKWPRSHTLKRSTHHFEGVMKWMLKKGREDADARATALILARGLVTVVERQNEFITEPVVPMLLSEFPEIVWPLIGQAIVSDRRRAWRFEHVLGDMYSMSRQKDRAILKLPEDTLFAWCHAHPDTAPAFVAALLPVLTSREAKIKEQALHPIMRRMLAEFGTRDDVLRAVTRNMRTYLWIGSRTNYYTRYEQPFQELLTHPISKVRHWAKQTLRQLSADIEAARNEDEEEEARWEV